MLIPQKLDKFIKIHDTFDDNSKSLNLNQLAVFFPPPLIFGRRLYLGAMSGYALSEEKPTP